MKKELASVLFTALLATSFANVSFAKDPAPQPCPPPGFHKKGDNLDVKLNLTPAQREQAKLIREEGRAKMEPIMKQMKGLHGQAEVIRKENMQKFEAILTPEQKAKFETLKQERKVKWEKKRANFEKKHPNFKK